MKTTATTAKTLPREIYHELYDYLCESIAEYGAEDCDENGRYKGDFDFESEDGHWYIGGKVEAYFEYEDDSFSHEFGIEECGHWEFDSLYDVTVDACYFIDDDENETDVEFDSDVFEHLHDKTTIVVGGVTINAGDEVVVKWFFGKWHLATFLYYDTINRRYFWQSHGNSYSNYGYNLKPLTDETRQLVGTY